MVNDVRASGISSPDQLVNSTPKILLDGALCKMSFISIFLCFLVSKSDFIRRADLPISQLQTQQVMTSQIRSHIEYLILNTFYTLVLIF